MAIAIEGVRFRQRLRGIYSRPQMNCGLVEGNPLKWVSVLERKADRSSVHFEWTCAHSPQLIRGRSLALVVVNS